MNSMDTRTLTLEDVDVRKVGLGLAPAAGRPGFVYLVDDVGRDGDIVDDADDVVVVSDDSGGDDAI
jgi:hypothetical protein